MKGDGIPLTPVSGPLLPPRKDLFAGLPGYELRQPFRANSRVGACLRVFRRTLAVFSWYRHCADQQDGGVMAINPSAHDSIPEGRTGQWAVLSALGVVFGDLGTSPLYTLQTVVQATGGQFTPHSAIGILSLIVWTLLITVSIKYCVFVMRADNHGEGGILALMALVTGRAGRSGGALVVAGLFGAALIYGDGIITPAISVLSALEGINVVTDAFKPYVLPVALVVLL